MHTIANNKAYCKRTPFEALGNLFETNDVYGEYIYRLRSAAFDWHHTERRKVDAHLPFVTSIIADISWLRLTESSAQLWHLLNMLLRAGRNSMGWQRESNVSILTGQYKGPRVYCSSSQPLGVALLLAFLFAFDRFAFNVVRKHV